MIWIINNIYIYIYIIYSGRNVLGEKAPAHFQVFLFGKTSFRDSLDEIWVITF